MMFVILICLVSIVQAVPAPGRGALEGYCNTDDHCKNKRNQCCVSFVLPGETRTDEEGSVTRFVDGKCEKLQSRNDACLIPTPSDDETTTGLHYLHCPCQRKYTCVPSGESSPVGQLGVCRPRCRSTRDCGEEECCVEYPSRGKRRGVCQPMGVFQAECLQINGSGRPTGIVKHSCPCREPYTCGNIIRPITDPTSTATCGFWKG